MSSVKTASTTAKSGVGGRRPPPAAKLFGLLKPYSWLIVLLVTLTIAGNSLNLVVPKLISRAIDSFTRGGFVLGTVIQQFLLAGFFIFFFAYLQSVVQTLAGE